MSSKSHVLRPLPLRMHSRRRTGRVAAPSHIEIICELCRFQFLPLFFGREPSALLAREHGHLARIVRPGRDLGRMKLQRHAAFAANGV